MPKRMRRFKLFLRDSLGYQVLIAAILGILVGLFFGPLTDGLKPLGMVYTMLLQMAVLPYICFSLIHGLGSITPETGKKIFKSGWVFLLTLWTLIFIFIFLLIQLIPSTNPPLIEAIGTSKFESNFTKNFLSYLIPQNPFYDIANNVVPAVAIFGLIGGLALMHIEKKEPLISVLERINQTIEKVLKWLGILSPIGVFIYIAIAFGTTYVEDLYKIQVYVFAFIFTALFITFWALPTLLTCLTPIRYKEVLKAFRFVCLVPFLTGLPTAALPFLNGYLKKLSLKHETHKRFRETSQTVLPIAYSFGNIGNAMILFFIMFLAYYYRHPLSGTEKTLLSLLTFPLSIGSSSGNINSIFFLIQELGFPEGTSDFFLQLKLFTYNFQILMSIAAVLTLIILTLYSYYGLLQVKWKQLTIRLATSFLILFLVIFSLKSLIPLPDVYENLYMGLKLTDVIPRPVQATIFSKGDTGTPRVFSNDIVPETLKQILSTRVLKVGFNTNSIPFCYYNNQKELVGFDIAYAYELAANLDCKLELIPFDFNALGQDLLEGVYDIGMSSIIMSESRILQMDFSVPYYEDNSVLIVPIAKKNEYLNLKEVEARTGLKIGSGGAGLEIAKNHFPNAEIFNIAQGQVTFNEDVDAILWSKSTALIWCLSNPNFVCIDYGGQIGKTYFSYPMRQHATDFGFFLNNWLSLKEQSGFKKEMQSYWIHGVHPEKRPPRWSILQNVLHLTD